MTYLTNPVLTPSFPFLKPGLSRALAILVVMNPLFKPTKSPFISDNKNLYKSHMNILKIQIKK